jgi:hypothetical protein
MYMFYDPLGRRDYISPTGGAGAQWFEYSGNTLVGESDGNVMTRRFVHGPGSDEPLAARLPVPPARRDARGMKAQRQPHGAGIMPMNAAV